LAFSREVEIHSTYAFTNMLFSPGKVSPQGESLMIGCGFYRADNFTYRLLKAVFSIIRAI
jgi:hypothetical protein